MKKKQRRVVTLKIHPAAHAFPKMTPERFAELKEDIRLNRKILEPIVLYEGKILDGRNRYKAYEELTNENPPVEIELKTETYDGNTPYCYVWSRNAERRDLIQAQRAAIFVRMKPTLKKELAEIDEQVKREGHKRRSEAKRGNKNAAKNKNGSSRANFDASTFTHQTQVAHAAMAGCSRSEIERQERLRDTRPDLANQVADGTMGPTHAMREMRRAEVSKKIAALPEGKFRVIYADPPWSYSDTREFGMDDTAKSIKKWSTISADDHFPTMPLADICALDVKSLAAEDSILLLWATFPLLPEALEVVKAWSFKYKTAFIWDKERGWMGNYHNAEAELLIVATRGSCLPDLTQKRAKQIQRYPRVKKITGNIHSRKPLEFRELIDSLWSGPCIELFQRGDAVPESWHVWGAEATSGI